MNAGTSTHYLILADLPIPDSTRRVRPDRTCFLLLIVLNRHDKGRPYPHLIKRIQFLVIVRAGNDEEPNRKSVGRKNIMFFRPTDLGDRRLFPGINRDYRTIGSTHRHCLCGLMRIQ